MSCSYADGLSPYENKGKLGLKEIFDSEEETLSKVKKLAEWITEARHVVVHTGAGISTSAGIPDFRGPNGVWTLESQGKKPDINISFNDAVPTKTHMALLKLIQTGKVHYIISQNIDGLHLRSGVPRKYLAELHGNMFIEQCSFCKRQFILKTATTSVGKKYLGHTCPLSKLNGRSCRGKMHDIILDWEHDLPEKDLEMSDYHSGLSDLSLCLGTTMQILPSGNLPLRTKKYHDGKIVICNLQPTKHDKKADMVINAYVDDVMCKLMEHLDLKIDPYDPDKDPTRMEKLLEWTIPASEIRSVHNKFREICCSTIKKVKTTDDPCLPTKKHKTETEIKDECVSTNVNDTKEL